MKTILISILITLGCNNPTGPSGAAWQPPAIDLPADDTACGVALTDGFTDSQAECFLFGAQGGTVSFGEASISTWTPAQGSLWSLPANGLTFVYSDPVAGCVGRLGHVKLDVQETRWRVWFDVDCEGVTSWRKLTGVIGGTR